MTNSEFNTYKKNFLDSLRVKEDGSTENDNNFKFSFIGGKFNETIVAKSFSEAIYRAFLNILISEIPTTEELSKLTQVDASTNMEKVTSDIKSYIDKLLRIKNFKDFRIIENSNGAIKFSYIRNYADKDITEFTLTLKDSSNLINKEEILPISIKADDDMVVTWIKKDNSIICHIVNSPYSINEPVSGNKFDASLETLDRIYGQVNQYIRSLNAVAFYIGYASLNPDDNPEIYSEKFGKTLSYQRAIIDKITLDRKNIKLIISQIKLLIETYTKELNKKLRTYRLLKRREHQISGKVRETIRDLK